MKIIKKGVKPIYKKDKKFLFGCFYCGHDFVCTGKELNKTNKILSDGKNIKGREFHPFMECPFCKNKVGIIVSPKYIEFD